MEPCRVIGATEIIMNGTYEFIDVYADSLDSCHMFVFKDAVDGESIRLIAVYAVVGSGPRTMSTEERSRLFNN